MFYGPVGGQQRENDKSPISNIGMDSSKGGFSPEMDISVPDGQTHFARDKAERRWLQDSMLKGEEVKEAVLPTIPQDVVV